MFEQERQTIRQAAKNSHHQNNLSRNETSTFQTSEFSQNVKFSVRTPHCCSNSEAQVKFVSILKAQTSNESFMTVKSRASSLQIEISTIAKQVSRFYTSYNCTCFNKTKAKPFSWIQFHFRRDKTKSSFSVQNDFFLEFSHRHVSWCLCVSSYKRTNKMTTALNNLMQCNNEQKKSRDLVLLTKVTDSAEQGLESLFSAFCKFDHKYKFCTTRISNPYKK